MKNTQLSKAFYQVNAILEYGDDALKEQLPDKLLHYIAQNKSKNYKWEFDPNTSLEDQNLFDETKLILTIIYRNYICDESERIELDKILIENDKKRNLKN